MQATANLYNHRSIIAPTIGRIAFGTARSEPVKKLSPSSFGLLAFAFEKEKASGKKEGGGQRKAAARHLGTQGVEKGISTWCPGKIFSEN
jgi:hypothetical protein